MTPAIVTHCTILRLGDSKRPQNASRGLRTFQTIPPISVTRNRSPDLAVKGVKMP